MNRHAISYTFTYIPAGVLTPEGPHAIKSWKLPSFLRSFVAYVFPIFLHTGKRYKLHFFIFVIGKWWQIFWYVERIFEPARMIDRYNSSTRARKKLIFGVSVHNANTNRFIKFGVNRTKDVRIIRETRGQKTDARVSWPQTSGPNAHRHKNINKGK
jgi:hypothetical protein